MDPKIRELLEKTCERISQNFHRQNWENAEKTYQYIDQSINDILSIQWTRTDKESWLKEIQGTVSQAAYALAKLNKFEEAVVTLERGLARLLSEALQRDRADLEQLKTTDHTDLYDRYRELVDRYHGAQLQQNVDALKTAQVNLDKTIEAIRQVPDHENFLKPAEFDLIQVAAQQTPLVYIITTSGGGLALIVRKEEITPVWLQELTTTALQKHVGNYRNAYEHRHQDEPTWFDTLEQTTHWLGQVLMDKLLQALAGEPQVTLIPVGLLNLLPLHAAAWRPDTTQSTGNKRYVLDRLTIHYAPNAYVLEEARKIAQRVKATDLLAVDEPWSGSANCLRNSQYEVQIISATFDPSNQQILSQKEATCDAVLEALPKATVLHFSGHGKADLNQPLQSRIRMANHEFLTLEEILTLRLESRLAILSACETGIPGTKLPDEVVSFAAGWLQAGVAGIVASLWSVHELSTALLMVRFYDYWREEQLDPVEALRQAQIWVRDTTNKEKVDYFARKHTALSLVNPKAGFAAMHLKATIAYHHFQEEDRDFEHPYHWAAFGFTGV